MEESTNIIRANSASNKSAHGHISEASSTSTTPTVNAAGSMCTSFSDSGYFLYKLIRAIPELCTCLKNFFRSVRRLCHTHASGNQAATTSGLEYPDTEIDVFAETHFRKTSQLAIYIGTYSHIETSGINLSISFPATNTSCSKESMVHGIIYRFLCSRERIVCTVWSSKSVWQAHVSTSSSTAASIPRR